MFVRIFGCFLLVCFALLGFDSADEQSIKQREQSWNAAIRQRDIAAAESFLAPDYFLAVAVPGKPLLTAPRKQWLENLKSYYIEEMRVGEMLVRFYGDVATVAYPYYQATKMNGQNINGDFLLTDIWVKRDATWKVAARYSSRFGASQ